MEGIIVGLAVLACPVGMGLCMWLMSRGMRGHKDRAEPTTVDDLRREQARIAAEIERLDEHPPAHDGEVAPRT